MTNTQSQVLLNHTLGPKLKHWITQQQPEAFNQPFSSKELDLFLQDQIEHNHIQNNVQLASLVDELVSMNKPQFALNLIDHHQELWSDDNFMQIRSEGIASMLTNNIDRAICCFKKALLLNPNEVASYVNLSQLYGQQQKWTKAQEYCLTGLKRAKNYPPLWESLWRALSHNNPSLAETKLKELAQEMDAWAGFSLFFALTQPNSQQAQLDNLINYYNKGLRDLDFLLEYTGLLGNLEQYETIEAVLGSQRRLPWQLQLHQLQAYLAQDKHLLFLEMASKLLKQPTLPHKNRKDLEQLVYETKANIKASPTTESQHV